MEVEPSVPAAQEFSLVLGGPLYQLMLRSGLLKPPLHRMSLRILVISGAAWLPLAALTLLGDRFAGGVDVPFLGDFEVQARLLLTLPLLILAELVVHKRIQGIVQQFLERRIVPRSELPKYEGILQSALRLRDSVPIELGMALLVFGLGSFLWRGVTSLDADTWYASVSSNGTHYTPAGIWYAFVSVPIVQFMLLRWYFRLFIFSQYLWRVSRLELDLVATHPDRSCGLGFLGALAFALAPFLLAHSSLLSGYIANRIIHQGARLPDFKPEIATLAVFLNLVTLGPLFIFSPRLNRARIAGLRSYGRLASEYVEEFDRKWISTIRARDESLLGSADIQSLADLANSFQVVQSIRLAPFGRDALIRLNVLIALPLLPLALTMFPLEELLQQLFKVLL